MMIVSSFLIGTAFGVSAGMIMTLLSIELRSLEDRTDIDSEVYRINKEV